MIVAITGVLENSHGDRRIAGAGKDEVAKVFVEHGFVSVAFADVMKRFCKELFGFTDEQLWAESERRALPDKRFLRTTVYAPHMLHPEELKDNPTGALPQYLTPRYALQKLGDWGRDCYPDIWANKALEIAAKLLTPIDKPYHGWLDYTPQDGLTGLFNQTETRGVVIPDMRFQNEFRRVKEEGGSVIRVKKTCDEFPSVLDDSHISERDILVWGDDKFDHIIENSGDLHFLKLQTEQLLAQLSGRIIPYDDVQKDIPPFTRT